MNSPPLPPILNALPVISIPDAPVPAVPVPVFVDAVAVVKKFILLITKDLTPEDVALFKGYDLVEYDDGLHKNLPIDAYDWDVLVLDLREKSDRYCIMKEVVPHRALYNLIVYCHKFEMDDIDVEYDNAFAKFPEKQANKQDWEKLLLAKRIKKPRAWVSFLGCLANLYSKVKN
jgi:hypothetical protein